MLPRSVEDIEATVAICREHAAPLLARGAGTSRCAQSVNVAVVIERPKYLRRVISVNAQARLAQVEPRGALCGTRRDAAQRHRLTFRLAELLAK